MKKKACKKLDIKCEINNYDSNVPEEFILRKIKDLNNDDTIHGILV